MYKQGSSLRTIAQTIEVSASTDYIFIELLPQGRKSKPLARAVNRRLAFLKRRGQLHSITTDNGTEFSAYRSIERSLGVPVYFARPLPIDGQATHRARQCADPSISAQAQLVCGLDAAGGEGD